MKVFRVLLFLAAITIGLVYVVYHKYVKPYLQLQSELVAEMKDLEVSLERPELNFANLARSWCITDTFELDEMTDRARSKDQREFDEALRAGLYDRTIWYHLYSDGRAAEEWLGLYRPAKWSFDSQNATILITFDSDPKHPMELMVRYLDQKNMSVHMRDGDLKAGLVMSIFEQPLAKPADDPFYPDNNTWRIKPRSPETVAQLKARLNNHMEHYVKLLQAMEHSENKDLTFKRSPSCLKIYSSAVGMRRDKDIPLDWYETFYSEKDALKAKELMTKAVMVKYDNGGWPEDNWIKDDIKILKHFQKVL